MSSLLTQSKRHYARVHLLIAGALSYYPSTGSEGDHALYCDCEMRPLGRGGDCHLQGWSKVTRTSAQARHTKIPTATIFLTFKHRYFEIAYRISFSQKTTPTNSELNSDRTQLRDSVSNTLRPRTQLRPTSDPNSKNIYQYPHAAPPTTSDPNSKKHKHPRQQPLPITFGG